MLTEKVQELIKKSRIVSFDDWQNHHAQVVAVFRQADEESRYLSDEDIDQIKLLMPELSDNLEYGRLLRDNVERIISQAREVVIRANPLLIEPGGGLYPPARAEACWRDFWHFMRCITYGISGKALNYTSDRGLGYMEELYRELNVPLEAMVLGLEQLKVFSLEAFATSQRCEPEPYFDRLIESMKQFRAVA